MRASRAAMTSASGTLRWAAHPPHTRDSSIKVSPTSKMTARTGICARSHRQMRERIHHALVHRALERNHEVGKVAHRLPTPLDEFGLVPACRLEDVDLAVVPGEAQRIPFLRLAAVAALPGV